MADETETKAPDQAGAQALVDAAIEASDEADAGLGESGNTEAPGEAEGGAKAAMLSDEDIESLLAQAQDAQQKMGQSGVDDEQVDPDDVAQPMVVPDLVPGGEQTVHGFDLLQDVQLEVKIELGRSEMFVDEVLRLSEGAVVQLDKLAGDPVDILVNDRLVARGEILVLNDNFCVRVGEILTPDSD